MKEYVLELAASQSGTNAKFNIVREYLQIYILRILHDEGFFQASAFLGGTALRLLHQLPRFSEDLDFSLHKQPKVSFLKLMKKVEQELISANYSVQVIAQSEKVVQSAFVKFEGLLHEAGISPLAGQKFSVKIDIDTKPPDGAILETKIVNKYFPIAFMSYDLPSLFAGKFHALLSRKYTKGRDFFDVSWYLSRFKGLSPNIILLTNALKQTGWDKEFPNENNWQDYLYSVIEKADWKVIDLDVRNFLENTSDMKIFTKENVLKLVKDG